MTCTDKQPTCEDRIGASLASTLDDLRTFETCAQHGVNERDDWMRLDTADRVELCQALDISVFIARREEGPLWDIGEPNEYGLSFDYVAPDTFTDQDEGYFRYQLSWGGPSTEFRFYTNPDFSPHRIEYWFLDWWDGASRTLRGDDERVLSDWFEQMRDCGVVESGYIEAAE